VSCSSDNVCPKICDTCSNDNACPKTCDTCGSGNACPKTCDTCSNDNACPKACDTCNKPCNTCPKTCDINQGPCDAGDGQNGDKPRVIVAGGTLEGSIDVSGSWSFLGIPYAKPPIGALRWARPQEPSPWSKVRDASQFGARCAQPESALYHSARSDDEDCLYLNVWAPAPKKNLPLPVMVWIHGGNHISGSSSEPAPGDDSRLLYGGAALAGKGVVVVTFNYRLGAFGFLSTGAAGDADPIANQGLWDQQFALRWVSENIQAFGGDPNNVTIFGQGSGAVDVCLHMVSSESRPYFQRAIGQSGGCTTRQPEVSDVSGDIKQWLEKFDCQGSDALACMRDVPIKRLVDGEPDSGRPFAPIVDKDFLVAQPRDLFRAQKAAKVPYILGSNRDEGSLFTSDFQGLDNEADFNKALQKLFPDVSLPALCDVYPVEDTDVRFPFVHKLAEILGDADWVCPTLDTALRASAAGSAVYLYNFDIVNVNVELGVAQATELAYVFGNGKLPDAAHRDASDKLQQYWTSFAQSGDPNLAGLKSWGAFSYQSDVRLNLSLDVTVLHGYRETQCSFWSDVFDEQFR
jgi:para-nitrobenzyl esterase